MSAAEPCSRRRTSLRIPRKSWRERGSGCGGKPPRYAGSPDRRDRTTRESLNGWRRLDEGDRQKSGILRSNRYMTPVMPRRRPATSRPHVSPS
jgi:hypothetical protein